MAQFPVWGTHAEYLDTVARWLGFVERGVWSRGEMRDRWRELDEEYGF